MSAPQYDYHRFEVYVKVKLNKFFKSTKQILIITPNIQFENIEEFTEHKMKTTFKFKYISHIIIYKKVATLKNFIISAQLYGKKGSVAKNFTSGIKYVQAYDDEEAKFKFLKDLTTGSNEVRHVHKINIYYSDK